jgi:hypothetical protein
MRATMFLLLFLAAASASGKITGAKWVTYDADWNMTSATAVLLEYRSTHTTTVEIYGRRDSGDWMLYDTLPAAVDGSTGTLIVEDLSDGWWSWCAIAGDGLAVEPTPQLSFWVTLPFAAVARWTLFR